MINTSFWTAAWVSAFSFPARVSALVEPEASKSAEGGDVVLHHTSCRQNLAVIILAIFGELRQSPSFFGDLCQSLTISVKRKLLRLRLPLLDRDCQIIPTAFAGFLP